METSLTIMAQASQMLIEATTIQKAKELMDLALTAGDWAKRKNMGEETIQYCRNYAFEAEKRMGELLKATERAKGTKGQLKGKDVSGSPQKEPPENNIPTLSDIGITKKESSNAQLLAGLPDDVFEKVKEGKVKVSVLRRQLKQKEDKDKIDNNTFPVIKGKFKTILVDPPWDYKQLSLAGRGHPEYSVMSLEDLYKVNIKKYAEENCHLYLWTTNNFIYEALKLGISWGFLYKTIITWVKPSIGLGSYFRNNTEHLLFFVKGTLNTRTNNTSTYFEAPRGDHSEKPEISYKIIEDNSYPKYLEYFGRRNRKGWEVYGNYE